MPQKGRQKHSEQYTLGFENEEVIGVMDQSRVGGAENAKAS